MYSPLLGSIVQESSTFQTVQHVEAQISQEDNQSVDNVLEGIEEFFTHYPQREPITTLKSHEQKDIMSIAWV